MKGKPNEVSAGKFLTWLDKAEWREVNGAWLSKSVNIASKVLPALGKVNDAEEPD